MMLLGAGAWELYARLALVLRGDFAFPPRDRSADFH
jgi:hypothetical protein